MFINFSCLLVELPLQSPHHTREILDRPFACPFHSAQFASLHHPCLHRRCPEPQKTDRLHGQQYRKHKIQAEIATEPPKAAQMVRKSPRVNLTIRGNSNKFRPPNRLQTLRDRSESVELRSRARDAAHTKDGGAHHSFTNMVLVWVSVVWCGSCTPYLIHRVSSKLLLSQHTSALVGPYCIKHECASFA
jgi:hypothetical protein